MQFVWLPTESWKSSISHQIHKTYFFVWVIASACVAQKFIDENDCSVCVCIVLDSERKVIRFCQRNCWINEAALSTSERLPQKNFHLTHESKRIHLLEFFHSLSSPHSLEFPLDCVSECVVFVSFHGNFIACGIGQVHKICHKWFKTYQMASETSTVVCFFVCSHDIWTKTVKFILAGETRRSKEI